MDNETFHISPFGQCASLIVMMIVIGVFIIKMTSYNYIDTINIFKDTNLNNVSFNNEFKPVDGLPATNSVDSEGNYVPDFEEYFPLMFIVKYLKCEEFKIEIILEPLNLAKYKDPSLKFNETMTCFFHTAWNANEYHMSQKF